MTKEKAVASGVIYNTISSGTRIVGTITAENDFRIDGEIEGEIVCQGKVVVGRTGRVNGKLTCMNAEIVGSMDGDLKVSEMLVLRSTSVVTGDIRISTLMVEPNAKFNGTCTMTQPAEAAKASKEK